MTASSASAPWAWLVMGASASAASASATLAPIIRSHSATAPVPVRIARICPAPSSSSRGSPSCRSSVSRWAGLARSLAIATRTVRLPSRRSSLAGLPGLGRIPEHAQNVVPELERDAQREAVAR